MNTKTPLEKLEESVDKACDIIDRLRAEKAQLLNLLKRAYQNHKGEMLPTLAVEICTALSAANATEKSDG